MQTFLPYPDFHKSAACLDRQRLGKQRVEAWQIYKAINNESSPWHNHPAVKMWKGYEVALLYYGMVVCEEWIDRGYKDTMYERFENEMSEIKDPDKREEMPHWMGDWRLHRSHKASLLAKLPEHYSELDWKPGVVLQAYKFRDAIKNGKTLPYYWPVE